MKKLKKGIAMFLTAVFVFSNTAFASDGQTLKTSGIEKFKNKIELFQTERDNFMTSNEAIENCKSTDLHQKLASFIEENNEFSTIFCGSYINDDNKLVVRLKEQTDRIVKTIHEVIQKLMN